MGGRNEACSGFCGRRGEEAGWPSQSWRRTVFRGGTQVAWEGQVRDGAGRVAQASAGQGAQVRCCLCGALSRTLGCWKTDVAQPLFSCGGFRQLKFWYEEALCSRGSAARPHCAEAGVECEGLEELGLAWVPWRPLTPQSPTGPRTPPPPARQKAMKDQILPSQGSHSGEGSQTSVQGPAWPWACCSTSRWPCFPPVELGRASAS